MLLLAVFLLLANIIISTDMARFLGIRRPEFALLMSLGLLIAVYTALFNLLGVFRLITFSALITFQIVFITGYWFVRKKELEYLMTDISNLITRNKIYFSAILALLVLTLLSAVMLPPNNQDSMSYHLARVVHWMQNKNIGYYFTSVDRQNRMGPGAEILILWLQILSSTDRLANLVQYFSFLFFCVSLPAAIQFVGIRKRNAIAISVITVATPMLLLQAATTQNDALAGILTWSMMIVALVAYRKGLDVLSNRFLILVGILVGAAFLVKPTSIIILLPLFAFIGVGYILKFKLTKTSLTRVSVAVAIFLLVSGPDIYRKLSDPSHQAKFDDVFFPLTKEWNSSRLFNVVLAGMHHSAFDYAKNEKFIEQSAVRFNAEYNKGSVKDNLNFYPHEDYAGNPIQFLTLLLMSIVSTVIIIFSPFKERYMLALLPVCSFLLLGLFLRDNPWISRLQLPVFMLMPLCFVPLAAIRQSFAADMIQGILGSSAFICLALGFLTVCQNAQRPLSLSSILNPRYSIGDMDNLYYLTSKESKAEHDKIIQLSRGNNVKTVGVIAGPGFLEYPLSWRLYKAGVRLIHVETGDVRNVDLIYAEGGQVPDIGDQYLKAGERLYLRQNPITTLTDKNELTLPLESLLLSDNATIRQGSIFFYSNGWIATQCIRFKRGNYLLKVRSSGAEVAGQGSHWNVYLGTRRVGEINSVTAGQTDSVYMEVLADANHQLRLDFDNDIFDASRGWDRNGEIEHISVEKTGTRNPDRTLLRTDTLTVALPHMIVENATHRPSGIFFSSNGKLHSPLFQLAPGDYTLILKSGGAWIAGSGSRLVISLNEKVIGEVISTKTGQINSVPFEVTDEGEYRVTIEFTNDMFDPVQSLDRNAEIEGLTIVKNKTR